MADIDAPLAWRMQQDGYLMKINQLRDENTKLCQQLADVTESVGRMEERCAKLRELVRELYDHIKESCDVCDECYCSSWDEDNECCVFDTYMRELWVGE